MKKVALIATLFVAALQSLSGASKCKTSTEKDTSQLRTANNLFIIGQFDAAGQVYQNLKKSEGQSFEVQHQLAYIALLQNHLEEAIKRYRTLVKKYTHDTTAIRNLAEAFYRKGEAAKAAALDRQIGYEGRAEQLERCGTSPIYGLSPDAADSTKIQFIANDPLPVIEAAVNGKKCYFIIDTGGADVVIDPELAAQLGIDTYGSATGTYAGGKKASSRFGIIKCLSLADYSIGNVPVQVLSTKQFSMAGKQISGVIGTVLLYHFLSSIDYRGHRLILRKENSKERYKLQRSVGVKSVPFWMAADHIMVVHGNVNDILNTMFIVDTGLAGAGFTCPESTMVSAGILINGKPIDGTGGGGTVKASPILIRRISIPEGIVRDSVMGYFGVFPHSLENGFGFHIGGLISHTYLNNYEITFDFKNMKLYFQ